MSDDRNIIVGMGELLWDCFPDARRPGGAPANVAFQAGQLGARGMILSRVGADADGDELIEFVHSCDLETACIQRDTQHPTGRVTVDTSHAQSPQYTIHENVAWDYLEFNDEAAMLLNEAAAVCFGTLAQRNETSRATIRKALAAAPDALKVYDVNLRQRYYARDWVEKSLDACSVVKLNHDEVDVVAELLGIAVGTPAAFADAIRDRHNVELVCITRGGDGCLAADVNETVDVPGEPVRVVDAVGAGDAFTAALIVARLRGWPVGTQAAFANKIGGLVASCAGAMPIIADRANQWIDRFESTAGTSRSPRAGG